MKDTENRRPFYIKPVATPPQKHRMSAAEFALAMALVGILMAIAIPTVAGIIQHAHTTKAYIDNPQVWRADHPRQHG